MSKRRMFVEILFTSPTLAEVMSILETYPKSMADILLNSTESYEREKEVDTIFRNISVNIHHGTPGAHGWEEFKDTMRDESKDGRIVFIINSFGFESMIDMGKSNLELFFDVLKAYDIKFEGFMRL